MYYLLHHGTLNSEHDKRTDVNNTATQLPVHRVKSYSQAVHSFEIKTNSSEIKEQQQQIH